jgi:hypothetical protein
MFLVKPIHTQLWRAGGGMLAFSLGALLLDVSIYPTSISLFFKGLALLTAFVTMCGMLLSISQWSKWRRTLEQPGPPPVGPVVTRVSWTWTMTQVLAGALLLAGCAALHSTVLGLLMFPALWLGALGVTYLDQARRVRRHERERGIVYYWRHEPGLNGYEREPVQRAPR